MCKAMLVIAQTQGLRSIHGDLILYSRFTVYSLCLSLVMVTKTNQNNPIQVLGSAYQTF